MRLRPLLWPARREAGVPQRGHSGRLVLPEALSPWRLHPRMSRGSLHWRLGKSVDSSSVCGPPLPLLHPARTAPSPPASFRNVCGDGGGGGGGGCPVGAPARALGVVVIGPVPRGLGNRSFRPGLFQAPCWSPSFVSSLSSCSSAHPPTGLPPTWGPRWDMA